MNVVRRRSLEHDIDEVDIRCVVVGTGSIGSRHLKVLSGSDEIALAAMPMRKTRQDELTELGYTVIPDWEAASAWGATHAIIATDTSRHPGDVEAAAKHGCDILVEKPMAADVKQCARCLEAVHREQKQLWVGCILRFSESMNTCRALLPSIGDLHSVRIECQSYLPDWRPHRPYRESYSARADEGGVLRDLIHEIDYAGWLFGWPEEVYGRVRNTARLGIDSDEQAQFLWTSQMGAFVFVSLDYLSSPPWRRMRICGNQGTLTWDGVTGEVVKLASQGSPEVHAHSQTLEERLLAEDWAFLTADSKQADERLATGEDGLKAVSICDAARCSTRSGREEKAS